ncbi:hypothetical protein BGW41_005126 [Actinomortierella wolfii]|nr:hypothetical protein BGW41_005126 [Actinomortierella wolfii]
MVDQILYFNPATIFARTPGVDEEEEFTGVPYRAQLIAFVPSDPQPTTLPSPFLQKRLEWIEQEAAYLHTLYQQPQSYTRPAWSTSTYLTSTDNMLMP